MSKLVQDIILLVVVAAGITSFFYNPLGENMEYIRVAMGAIIGFLLKEPIVTMELPVVRAIKK